MAKATNLCSAKILIVCQHPIYTKRSKQSHLSHLLALRRNVSRCLYNPFTSIVMLIKLCPESLEHWDVGRVALGLLLALASITTSFDTCHYMGGWPSVSK